MYLHAQGTVLVVLLLGLSGCTASGPMPGGGEEGDDDAVPPTSESVAPGALALVEEEQEIAQHAIYIENRADPEITESCTIWINRTMHVHDTSPQVFSLLRSGGVTMSGGSTNYAGPHARVAAALDSREYTASTDVRIAHTTTLEFDLNTTLTYYTAAANLEPVPAGEDWLGDGDPSKSLRIASSCPGAASVHIAHSEGAVFEHLQSTDSGIGLGTGAVGPLQASFQVDTSLRCACEGQEWRALVAPTPRSQAYGTISFSQDDNQVEWSPQGDADITEITDLAAVSTDINIDMFVQGEIWLVAGAFTEVHASPVAPAPGPMD